MRPLLKWRASHMWPLAVALVLGLALLGCEPVDGGDDGTTTTVSPTTAPSTPSTVSSSEWILPDGHIKVLGFITNAWVEGGVRHLSIDYATLIEGEAAATAEARADGLIGPGETWDAEFYIDNDYTTLRTYHVSDSAEIYTQFRDFMVTLDGTLCSWSDFDGFWGGGALPEGDAHLPTSPWWIERDGDTVVWIMQMFTP
jgi:hypothetical protein